MTGKGSNFNKAGNNANEVKPGTPEVNDIQKQRELYEQGKKLSEQEEEIKLLKAELEGARATSEQKEVKGESTEMAQLKAQVEQLSKQLILGAKGDKALLFRAPTASDMQDEEVVFTARNVFYVVGSYIDAHQIERTPPHKLIVFLYQASDIRKDGKEETIKNFCQYATKLKTEITYLRNHPHYGISFSENTNEMMAEDAMDITFRVQAANQIFALSPEAIYERAKEAKIPNYQNKSAEELKPLIVKSMADHFKEQQKQLADDILRRRVMATMDAHKNKAKDE